jgi:hypothetical protein
MKVFGMTKILTSSGMTKNHLLIRSLFSQTQRVTGKTYNHHVHLTTHTPRDLAYGGQSAK